MDRQPNASPRAVVLENARLRAVLLPYLGMKIASIVYKPVAFEALFQPKALGRRTMEALLETPEALRAVYRPAFAGADFSAYDTSGMDDAIPTIDACRIPQWETPLYDHGHAWSAPWQVEAAEQAPSDAAVYRAGSWVEASVDLPDLPLHLVRKCTLDGSSLRLDYRLTHRGKERLPWLWALHGLFAYDAEAELELPWPKNDPTAWVNVQNEEIWTFDLSRIGQYPMNHTYKFYLRGSVSEGRLRLRYPRQGVVCTMTYDARQFPYLGVWVTTGGFKGECNIAPEPTNGYYDSLARALETGRVAWIAPGETCTWSVNLAWTALEDGDAH